MSKLEQDPKNSQDSKEIINLYNLIPFGSNKDIPWEDNGRSKSIVWTNPEGSREVLSTIFYSDDYRCPMADIEVYVINPITISKIQLIRIQAVLNRDTKSIHHNVYLEAVNANQSLWPLALISYFAEENGRRFPVDGLIRPITSGSHTQMPHDEYEKLLKSTMLSEGLFHVSELPESIDINATVLAVLEQLKNRDLSKPHLIAKA